MFYDLNGGINGDLFAVASTDYYLSIDGLGGIIEWRLTNLNLDVPLTGVNIITPYSNAIVSSFGENFVTFQYEDIAIPSGFYFEAQFISDNQNNSIPEPTTMLLLGSGLLGLTGLRRKFTKS